MTTALSGSEDVFHRIKAFSIVYSTPVILLYVLIAWRLGGGFALGGAVKG